jgi:hypothetical protein
MPTLIFFVVDRFQNGERERNVYFEGCKKVRRYDKMLRNVYTKIENQLFLSFEYPICKNIVKYS